MQKIKIIKSMNYEIKYIDLGYSIQKITKKQRT